MSLKHDIEEYPEMWSKEIVAAVEDYKNGKRNSKKKLRKFVNREISEYYYNELIERYSTFHRINKDKKDRELSRKIKSVLSVAILWISMLCGLVYVIEQHGKSAAVWYISLWIWAFSYALSN